MKFVRAAVIVAGCAAATAASASDFTIVVTFLTMAPGIAYVEHGAQSETISPYPVPGAPRTHTVSHSNASDGEDVNYVFGILVQGAGHCQLSLTAKRTMKPAPLPVRCSVTGQIAEGVTCSLNAMASSDAECTVSVTAR